MTEAEEMSLSDINEPHGVALTAAYDAENKIKGL